MLTYGQMPLPAAPALPATTLVLNYDRTRAAHAQTPRWLRALALLLTLPAALAPFVNFTYDISPMYVIREFFHMLLAGARESDMFLVLLAIPFFLGPAIVIAHVRLLVHDSMTRPERAILLSFAAASASATLSFLGFGLYQTVYHFDKSDLEFLPIFAIGPALIGAGCFLVWRLRRRGSGLQSIVMTAMRIAYVANAIGC